VPFSSPINKIQNGWAFIDIRDAVFHEKYDYFRNISVVWGQVDSMKISIKKFQAYD
jgi:hypothetical protein